MMHHNSDSNITCVCVHLVKCHRVRAGACVQKYSLEVMANVPVIDMVLILQLEWCLYCSQCSAYIVASVVLILQLV